MATTCINLTASTSYRNLLERLKAMSEDELDNAVTVYVRGVDEYYPLDNKNPWEVSDTANDVLDDGHTYLVV